MTVIGCNQVTDTHVNEVMRDMKVLGPPTIRVLLHAGHLHAIEGTHRLEAAKRLGVRPRIVVVADDTTDGNVAVLDVYDEGQSRTVEQLRATHIHTATHIRHTVTF